MNLKKLGLALATMLSPLTAVADGYSVGIDDPHVVVPHTQPEPLWSGFYTALSYRTGTEQVTTSTVVSVTAYQPVCWQVKGNEGEPCRWMGREKVENVETVESNETVDTSVTFATVGYAWSLGVQDNVTLRAELSGIDGSPALGLNAGYNLGSLLPYISVEFNSGSDTQFGIGADLSVGSSLFAGVSASTDDFDSVNITYRIGNRW